MTRTNSKRAKRKNQQTRTTIQDQHQHLENKKLNDKQDLIDSVQENFIAQSHSLTTVSRMIISAIIAIIWAICYSKTSAIIIPNCWILGSLILSIIYFLLEITHYLADSIYYYCKSKNLGKTNLGFNLEQESKKVESHSSWSFSFLCGKVLTAIVSSVVFIIGLIIL